MLAESVETIDSFLTVNGVNMERGERIESGKEGRSEKGKGK